MNSTASGLLITVDGPGGAGKTTTTRHLSELLALRGYLVHATAEPSRGELGELARRRSDIYRGRALACLVAADRYHQLDTELRPLKSAGRVVVCDRYVASSLVLQRMDGVSIDFLAGLNSGADVPDLAVILTVEPAVAARRIEARGTRHRFETGIASSAREAELYQEASRRLVAHGYPVLTVDTTHLEPLQVAERVAERITELLPGPRDTSGSG